MKSGTYNNSNMLNSTMIFSFKLEMSILPLFGLSNQNFLFKIKVVTYSNSNMLNLVVMFICHVLDMKYPS